MRAGIMTVLTLMALALDQELQDYGIFCLSRADCEKIIAAVLERTAKEGNSLPVTAKQSDDISKRST
jgi:hypothetical protein